MRPAACRTCGTPLPVPARAGRPRLYCSARCRYGARHDRDRRREREPRAAVELPPAPEPDRAAIAAELALLVAPAAAPAAPEDQLARALLELRAVGSALERLRHELPPRLAGPAGKLAGTVARGIARSFPEIE